MRAYRCHALPPLPCTHPHTPTCTYWAPASNALCVSRNGVQTALAFAPSAESTTDRGRPTRAVPRGGWVGPRVRAGRSKPRAWLRNPLAWCLAYPDALPLPFRNPTNPWGRNQGKKYGKPQWACGLGRVPRNRLSMLYDIASGTQVRLPVGCPSS